MSSFEKRRFCPECGEVHALIFEDVGSQYIVSCPRELYSWTEECFEKEVKEMNYMALKEDEDIEATLEERGSTYGEWKGQAAITDSLTGIIDAHECLSGAELEPYKRQALFMISSKIARIVNGDSNHVDSWRDIEGYARLVRRELENDPHKKD